MRQTMTLIQADCSAYVGLLRQPKRSAQLRVRFVLIYLLRHAVACALLRSGSDIDVDSELACNRRPKQPHAIACSPRITAGRAAMRVTHASTAG